MDKSKLQDYISYFEDESQTFYSWETPAQDSPGTITLGYPTYDDKFEQFIKDTYEHDLLEPNYMNYLGENVERYTGTQIKDADLNVTKSLLTYFVRGERFSEGTWAKAIDNRIFLHCLYRLKELLNE